MMSRFLLPLLFLLPFGWACPLRAATFAQAEELYKAKHYPEAQTAFEAVIAAEPGNADAAYYLGDLAIMRGARKGHDPGAEIGAQLPRPG